MKEIKITVADNEVATIVAALSGSYEELHVTTVGRPPVKKRKKYDEIASIGRSSTAAAVMSGIAASGKETFRDTDAAAWLEAHGLSPNSASSTIHRLAKAGYIVKKERGIWAMVPGKTFTKAR